MGNLGTSFNLVLLENPWWIGSNEGDLEILDLRCKKYWILNFFIEHSIKLQEMVLEGNFSLVTNSHLGTTHVTLQNEIVRKFTLILNY